MFDGFLPGQYSSGVPASIRRFRVRRSVVVAVVLALLGATLEVALGLDANDGAHIEFLGP